MSGKVGFRISGEFLTDFSRDVFIEGRWRYALNLIVDGLVGISHEQAIDILMGRSKLVGENTVDLVPDEPNEELQQRIAYKYGPTLDMKDRYYQPYAYVDSYCADDLVGPREGINRCHPYRDTTLSGVGLPRMIGLLHDLGGLYVSTMAQRKECDNFQKALEIGKAIQDCSKKVAEIQGDAPVCGGHADDIVL